MLSDEIVVTNTYKKEKRATLLQQICEIAVEIMLENKTSSTHASLSFEGWHALAYDIEVTRRPIAYSPVLHIIQQGGSGGCCQRVAAGAMFWWRRKHVYPEHSSRHY